MRAFVVVLGCLLLSTASADARPKHPAKHRVKPRVAISRPANEDPPDRPAKKQRTKSKKPRPEPAGQSIGAPWSGRLRKPSRLRDGERYHLRRPQRTYGTRTTVEHTRRAILDTLDLFPKEHVLAIGDLSAASGGAITEHHSHQSGRDVDLGLFYTKRPAGYPDKFVTADASTLHSAAMWALISNLVSTRKRDGGVLMMFLDFELQGVIYQWARKHGIDQDRLDTVFQFPHGRGASDGIVRHEPNHDDHLHVRFRCAKADEVCR